ncbi:hypothetical protein BU15DRAFT_64514 [Melanogaster broomeanus]|nr:hypothetical protein BU15DRAFT_64514 [Melanogaster broomeanus]
MPVVLRGGEAPKDDEDVIQKALQYACAAAAAAQVLTHSRQQLQRELFGAVTWEKNQRLIIMENSKPIRTQYGGIGLDDSVYKGPTQKMVFSRKRYRASKNQNLAAFRAALHCLAFLTPFEHMQVNWITSSRRFLYNTNYRSGPVHFRHRLSATFPPAQHLKVLLRSCATSSHLTNPTAFSFWPGATPQVEDAPGTEAPSTTSSYAQAIRTQPRHPSLAVPHTAENADPVSLEAFQEGSPGRPGKRIASVPQRPRSAGIASDQA